MKDKNTHPSHVIYKGKCNCGQTYIGETPDYSRCTDGEPLDFVEEFTYLGSLVAKDNAARKDIKARLGKAPGAFARLQPVLCPTLDEEE